MKQRNLKFHKGFYHSKAGNTAVKLSYLDLGIFFCAGMANYYKIFSKLLATGAIAGSGFVAVCLSSSLLNDKSRVRAKHPHGIASHKWDANWDRRNPVSIVEELGISPESKDYQVEVEKYIPKATRHVFLIRHGQYNLDGATDKEKTLTILGKKQAEYTGNRLKELNFPYTSMYRSTMLRAQETSDVILSCLDIQSPKEIKDCNLLEEGAPIPPEPAVGHWKPEAYQFYQDGPRIEAAFRKYIHRADVRQTEDSYDIIVCHSNVIRYFVCRALQFPPDAWLRFTLYHCSVTWLVITPTGRVIVRGLGDSGHIPADSITSN